MALDASIAACNMDVVIYLRRVRMYAYMDLDFVVLFIISILILYIVAAPLTSPLPGSHTNFLSFGSSSPVV
jgi:hypothetical protein